MISSLDVERLHSLDPVRAFLDSNEPVDFKPRSWAEAYAFVQRTLARFGYARLGKADKGALRRFLGKTTGLSRAQLTRLVRQYLDTGWIVDRRGGPPARPFERRCAPADIRLLADVDATLGQMAGAGDPRGDAPRARGVRRRALRAPRGDLGQPPLQPARLAVTQSEHVGAVAGIAETASSRCSRRCSPRCRSSSSASMPTTRRAGTRRLRVHQRQGRGSLRPGRAEALPQLPPPLPVRHRGPRRQGQGAPTLPPPGRRDAVREAQVAAGTPTASRGPARPSPTSTRSPNAMSDLEANRRANRARDDPFRAIGRAAPTAA